MLKVDGQGVLKVDGQGVLKVDGLGEVKRNGKVLMNEGSRGWETLSVSDLMSP